MAQTRIIPGSHRWTEIDSQDPHPDEITLVGKPADAFIFNANVMHRTGANTSGSMRKSMFVSYVRNDAPPGDAHNQIFSVSATFREGLPHEARLLLSRGSNLES